MLNAASFFIPLFGVRGDTKTGSPGNVSSPGSAAVYPPHPAPLKINTSSVLVYWIVSMFVSALPQSANPFTGQGSLCLLAHAEIREKLLLFTSGAG